MLHSVFAAAKAVHNSIFYNASNIFILDDQQPWDLEEIRVFLSREVKLVSPADIYEYSPEHMLETLMLRHGGKSMCYDENDAFR